MISIVIPAYNEETVIEETIERCQAILIEIGNAESEVIVVDDASSDNTYGLAKNTTAIVLKHPHNIGYGRSLKDGIRKAQNEIIVITDADGTYPIEQIPALIELYKEGFDMVVGARQGKNYRESFFKSLLRYILKFLVEFTAGRKIPDINSGLRVFSKTRTMPFFPNLCDTFSFTTSLTLAYMMTGKFVTYTPIEYHKRVGKTKVKLFRDALRTLQFIIEAILYYNPIKIFIIFSAFLLGISAINFIIGIVFKLLIGYILGVSCIILSIFAFILGLLSVQLKQILTFQQNC